MKRISNKIIILSLLLSAISFGFAKKASALTSDDIPIPTQIEGLDQQVDVTVDPQYPKPGDSVTITLEAYGIDLDNTPITWTIGNNVVLQGKGQKVYTMVAGKANIQTIVNVELLPAYSRPIDQSITIEPENVDIIWEARTYTPPFYKGKAMFTPEEKAVFVAIPNVTDANGNLSNPKLFTYKWIKDEEVQGDVSGYGQDSFSYTGDILMQPVETRVQASKNDGAVAENYINVETKLPETNLYEDSSLYGILFNHEISNEFLFGDKPERTIAVFPYYLGVANRSDSAINYNWAINGNAINVPTDQNEMTFRNTQNEEGKSFVDINIKNTNNFLENSEASTYIDFAKPKTGFSF